MAHTTVFVLDDDAQILRGFKSLLKSRGFNVLSAGYFKELDQEIDVAVLDMQLVDRREGSVSQTGLTGADVGLTLRRLQSRNPPEFLIYSGFSLLEYYRRAVKLGVAAYLDKRGGIDVKDVIPYVRVLALRRTLSIVNKQVMDGIQQIAEGAADASEAASRFSLEILGREMSKVLGAPFTLLITELREGGLIDGTTAYTENLGLPSGALRIYDDIQRLIFVPGTFEESSVLSIDDLLRFGVNDEANVLNKLDGGYFVPLAKTRDFALSLAIRQEDTAENPLAENAQLMANLITRYFRDSVVFHLLEVARREVARSWAQAEERRKKVSRATADLFKNVGNEQIRILDEARRTNEVKPGPQIKRLRALGEDLRDAGDALSDLVGGGGEQNEIELVPFIGKVWAVICEAMEIEDEDVLQIRGEAWSLSNSERLYASLTRILRWIVVRGTAGLEKGDIRIAIESGAKRVELAIEDNSPRLNAGLRKLVFEPFALGSGLTAPESWQKGRRFALFLAKLLVESQAGCSLVDGTHDMPDGDRGNRFVLRLPPAGPRHSAHAKT